MLDAFISHSSADSETAARVEQALESDGLKAWLDRSEIRLGALLRNELQTAIEQSRVVILLWSKAAAASRWVAAEVLTAFHLDRFIVPCILDRTRLPQFLAPSVYLDFHKDEAHALKSLGRAVREAPTGANAVPPMMSSQSQELKMAIQAVGQGQWEELAFLQQRKLKEAQEMHALVDAQMRQVERRWRFDVMVLNLAAYHRKNAYMLKHWDAIQAGRARKDRLLTRAERLFFDALFVNPVDYTALNGLGSVLILQRELEAAEFFVLRAIALAKQAGIDYQASEQDLEMIRRFKQQD